MNLLYVQLPLHVHQLKMLPKNQINYYFRRRLEFHLLKMFRQLHQFHHVHPFLHGGRPGGIDLVAALRGS